MNRIKNIFLFLVIGMFSFSGTAQNLEKWLEKQQPVNFQKLYLHTDREFYFQNDTLWFAAYFVQGQQHSLSTEACNLYVDIINLNGETVKDELFIVRNGLASGYVSLADTSLSEGVYLLRAYTDYLRNFGEDGFFTKHVRISAIKNSMEVAEDVLSEDKSFKEIPVETFDKFDIQFLPEGGFLLADVSNCVAFKVLGLDGKHVNISGQVMDENNIPVLDFLTVYKGTGKFFFNPKKGKSYTAIIDSTGQEIALPLVREEGVKIKLVSQDEDLIRIMVHGKGRSHEMPYYLTAMHRGRRLFSTEISLQRLNSLIEFETSALGDGINRFVLLDSNLSPISERLVFNHKTAVALLDVEVSEDAFSTRDEVEINIAVDEDYLGQWANVSVAVVDENYLNSTGISQNIASYLLLDSELKGHVESPASYFVDEYGLSAKAKLDLLMCTNGWSNYVWNFLNHENIQPEIKPEFGFTLSGSVHRALGKKALKEGSVSILIKTDSNTQFADQDIDEFGKFNFENIIFYDSATVFAQARDKRDKHNLKFEMQLSEFKKPKLSNYMFNHISSFSDIPISVYRQRYFNEMRMKEFHLNKNNILLEEIEVIGRSFLERHKKTMVRKNNGPALLAWETTAGSFNIIDYLLNNVPGVTPIENGQSISLVGASDLGWGVTNEPVIYIDGGGMVTIEEAKLYPIEIFETIEILTPPLSYFYRAPAGVILLTTKSGRSLKSIKPLPLQGGKINKYQGFTKNREFYSPKYTAKNIDTETPDYRNTLYWNPNVKLGGFENRLSFFTCDNLSRYKIFVEGITENGTVCLGETSFEVNSRINAQLKVSEVTTSETGNIQIEPEATTSENLSEQNTSKTAKANQKSNYEVLVASALNKEPVNNIITGKIMGAQNQPVEFATLYNLTKKTSCITNAKGFYKLKAVPGDKVKIQHLNYETKDVKISGGKNDFVLEEKDFVLNEVMVSSQAAFDLFNKACQNTWNTFKDENLTRAYCKIVRQNGQKITQVIDLDLDVVQKKNKHFAKGEKILPFKVQEYKKTDTLSINDTFNLTLKLFYPQIQEIYWVDLPKNFSYYKIEDSENIKLYLKNKKTYDQKVNIEINISRDDSLLQSFAMIKRDLLAVIDDFYENDTFYVEKTQHYIDYDYSAGFGVLNKYYQSITVKDPSNANMSITVSQNMVTTNKGELELEKRRGRRRIYRNSFDPAVVSNRYENKFWNEEENIKVPYNFSELSSMKLGNEQ